MSFVTPPEWSGSPSGRVDDAFEGTWRCRGSSRWSDEQQTRHTANQCSCPECPSGLAFRARRRGRRPRWFMTSARAPGHFPHQSGHQRRPTHRCRSSVRPECRGRVVPTRRSEQLPAAGPRDAITNHRACSPDAERQTDPGVAQPATDVTTDDHRGVAFDPGGLGLGERHTDISGGVRLPHAAR